MRSDLKKILKIGIFPFLIFMLNTSFLSIAEDVYLKYSIDSFSHFLGGVSMAYVIYHVLSWAEKKGWLTIKKSVMRMIIIVMAVTTVAVVWEFYEFTYDQYYWGNFMQPNVADTIKDLCLGMMGALIFSTIKLHKKRK